MSSNNNKSGFNEYSKPVCNLNTSQFYANKEQWNDKQFQRNSENINIFQRNFVSFQNALNIPFSENYRTQRREAYDMFEKRRLDVNENDLTKKATVGIVDFQDSQYRQYLMNKEIKR
jgi:hypothetical protein